MAAELIRRAKPIEKTKLKTSLESLVTTSDKKLKKIDLVRRNEDYLATAKGASELTEEEIKLLTHGYRQTLMDKGVPSTLQGNRYYNHELGTIASLKKELNLPNGYLDFIAKLDKRFPAETVKIHLGTDGLEYSDYTYRLLTNNKNPNSVPHYISRKTLATSNELEKILEISSKGMDVEDIVKIGSKKIRLYDDMDGAIQLAHTAQLTEGTKFNVALKANYKQVMNVPENRQKVVELIANLQKDVNLNKPIVLIDFAGARHAQSFTLQQGIRWLGQSDNWKLLSPAQQKLLGGKQSVFSKAKVNIHVGVIDPLTNPNIENLLGRMKIDGVQEFPHSRDIVETFRGFDVADASLLTGTPVFKSTGASQQSGTLMRKLVIANEIKKRKIKQAIAQLPTQPHKRITQPLQAVR